jgi:HK97 family phage major capsid protein
MSYRAPSKSALTLLEKRREQIRASAESLLESRKAAGVEELDAADSVRMRAMVDDLRDLDETIDTTREDIRRGQIPERYRRLGLGGGGAVNSAGRLAPLGYGDEQLRRAFDQVNRGETAVLEKRDPGFTTATPLVPPELYPIPVFPRHEGRLLDRLPGIAIDVPQLAYIEVVSVTGTAAIVAEGAAKPELLMPAAQKTATARKVACHVGVSWEAYSGDFPSFASAVQTELMRVAVDAENLQLYSGTGEANGQINGLLSSPNILTRAATGVGTNAEHWTDLAAAIADLRTGPALCAPNLLLLHPATWQALRTEKDEMGRFYVAADPSQGQTNQAWGIDVLQSTQFTAGVGVLFDTTLYGRAVVREGLITRIGYSGTDFTDNIVRFVSEERLTQTIERPAAICKITGLPTAAPAAGETKTTAKK